MDVVLEKGMPTVIPIYALHHDSKYYPDPERYDPERFNENEKKKRHHYVYLPSEKVRYLYKQVRCTMPYIAVLIVLETK